MPKIKLLVPGTFNGGTVAAGEIIEVPERSAASLIEEGAAEAIEQEATGSPQGDENPDGGSNTPGDQEKDQDGQDNGAQDEELAKVRKTLDNKFKRDDLAAAAKDLGVEFAFDAKKAEIVEAVIAAGKAEVLLQA